MELKDNLELRDALAEILNAAESLECNQLDHKSMEGHSADQKCPAESRMDLWVILLGDFLDETWGNK